MNDGINDRVLEKITFYEKHYVPTKPLFLNNLGDKAVLTSKDTGKCRFCGLATPDVTFDKIAHAFPELIGNKNLFSDYECDNCNSKFSLYESYFANYLGVKRTISLVDGKRGVPKFQSRDKKAGIQLIDGVLKIETHEDSGFVAIDSDKKKMYISTLCDPYIPRFAYKALVKMGLTMMPQEEMLHFSKTLEWLQNDNIEKENFNTSSFVCFKSFAPGRNPLMSITAMLFKRKDPSAQVPYASFLLAFQNYTFQIFLPFSDMDDHLLGKTLTLAYFPNPIDATLDGPSIAYTKEDLSGVTIVKQGENNVVMSFDEMIEMKVDSQMAPT